MFLLVSPQCSSTCCITAAMQLLDAAGLVCVPITVAALRPCALRSSHDQEQIVQREHRKETKRGRKKERQMMVQGGLRQEPGAGAEEEEEEASQGHVITYCSLDFPRLYDTVRWRLAMVKKNLEVRGLKLQEGSVVMLRNPWTVPSQHRLV